MPFSKLLMRVVADSKKTSKQIIDECNERGRKVDKAYMSKLLNNKVPAPSEELARMLAQICNYDERKLVLESYIDKAPKEVYEALVSIKFMITITTLNIFQNTTNKETLKQLEEELNKEPIADFVIDLIDNKADIININENGIDLGMEKDNFTMSLREPIALPVKDNAMFPIVPEGSQISLLLQEKYHNGDILAIKVKKQEDFIVRYALFNGEEIILTALNKEFKPLTYKKDEIIILGKVTRVITEI